MTPTPEDIERERDRAHALLRQPCCDGTTTGHWSLCTAIATALAARVLEATAPLVAEIEHLRNESLKQREYLLASGERELTLRDELRAKLDNEGAGTK